MKRRLYVFLICVLTSCNNQVNNKFIKKTSNPDGSSIETDLQLFDTILINKKSEFHIKGKQFGDFILLNSTSDSKTTFIDSIDLRGFGYIKYPDFNHDGNVDILIDYIGNNSTYFLYLFDSSSNTFRNIKNYLNFPDAIQLTLNPKYYYSYQRAGCADMNWVSDFFKIEDFKIVHLGHLYGQGCDAEIEEEPQVIKIYKLTNGNKNANRRTALSQTYSF